MRVDLLTMSLELRTYYTGLRLSTEDVRNAGFSATDFEFYLTDDKYDADKYYVTAFWKAQEIEKGLDWLNRWRVFVNNAAGRAIDK